MDASYLSQQVNTIIGQLHGLFDEIGVSNHDREGREAELFVALSETLHNQVKQVTTEKKDMVDEANRLITVIRQMEVSLDDSKSQRNYHPDDDDLKITVPLSRCLTTLKEKHQQISRLHRERFEQVKKLVQALESYSSHLEPTFVRIALPPTGPNQSLPPTFDLSPPYVDKLDDEFTRVYEEYTRRVATVKSLSENIIQLWAELGTPQAQTDGAIVKYYRDAPEQLGLHEEDLARLRGKRDKLADEKKNREKRLKELKMSVAALWEKLGVEESERKVFLNGNRGCGVRQINEFEDELGRLNELKRQNLHLFVEDARYKLQELWDALYYSEDEMLEFTPAFSDVYSDALLEAHEREISRLETLREQRAPTLALVERHRNLVHERDELAASSQDASRLMMRGQKGERRDPGKLLREEKMRKRISKELPKIAAELRKMLEKWEDEYGRPFLVHGERYLDNLEMDDPKPVPGPRSKTPAGPPPSTAKKPAPPSRANSNANASRAAPATRSKTPTANQNGFGSTLKRNQAPPQAPTNPTASPSRIPSRAPLTNLKHGNNSPERPRPDSRAQGPLRPGPPLMRAPPPKMRELVPGPELETPSNAYRANGQGSSIVRQVEPEDVYDDRTSHQGYEHSHRNHDSQSSHSSMRSNERFAHPGYPQAPPPRQISNTSTAVSGSENWETYDDNSEPEPDASDAYYAKVRAARGKRFTPEDPYSHSQPSQTKRMRGIPPPTSHAGHAASLDNDAGRIISGSEWTDEDPY
ncbi:microtubule associated protein-domain-containing protein [Pseudomassariella vexata]|uniref:Microtubule associated protein-domain-containing protein n=1 Tax=Pseudomassariella vexata TaxID=1141098 RepID=A0A1Y2EEN5_9PEZI|nr:microtubule associated protein-domain-containing protein [Pseudomassariella vexata]ORY70043.1 microtubule associated protein-domain-containing protein [Pseudomassariella vexata]